MAKACWIPEAMRVPPPLGADRVVGPVRPRYALLINPFYPKDRHASFGKHVLTPTLALTSIAGATPPEWDVAYWDENLLQGPPPCEPFPQVVGITVHLTFAAGPTSLHGGIAAAVRRSFSGACTCFRVPTRLPRTPMRWRSARACGSGRRSSATSKPARSSRSIMEAISGLIGKSLRRAATCCHGRSFLDDDELDRHPGLPQSLWVLLSGHGRPVDAVPGARRRTGRRPSSGPTASRTASSSTTTWDRGPEYLRRLCLALRPLEKIWSAAVSIDVTDDPSLVREMALAGCTGVFVGFESLADANLQADARRHPVPRTMRGGW